jgi:peptidoglycan/xylan/chitin deacetylase (PgdA/CDA1 family)
MNRLTIVMYHYVRDLKHSRYPEIKGLDIRLFKEQILYLKRFYTFVTMEQVIDCIDNQVSLPDKAVLLSFDDGYIDHFTNVFPILLEHGIQGSFFPPVKAIKEHRVLDVNKVHFILAIIDDIKELVREIFKILDKHREEYQLDSNEDYYERLAKANRFDNKDVIFVKRILQLELNEDLRLIITDILFKKYIGINEEAFSRELYMNIDQIKTLKRCGMHIGSHGFDHYWLNSLSKKNQDVEIKKSLDFIKEIGGDLGSWTMCYPYGGYNEDTLEVLQKYACKLALTTKVNIATIDKDNRFELQRLDTNDLPMVSTSNVNSWYKLG